MSPAWHQWLRHVRRDPPSLEEQAADVERIRRIRELAKQADERWRLAGTTAEAVKVGEIPRHRLEAGKGIDVGKEEDESSKQEEERRQQVARTMACAGGVASGGMQEAWTRTAAREQPPRDERIDEKRKSNAAQEEDKKDPWAESERARDTTRKWQPQAWTPPRTSSR